MPEDLTRDDFLGGRLRLWQPRHGYRAGIDPVLLAAAVPARAGQSVLDIGCGVGAAALCLAVRVPGLALHGIELQPDYAALARRNAEAAGIRFAVTLADLRALPEDLRGQSFDHVITNPPYFERQRGTPARDSGREAALGEGMALALWLDAAIRRVAPGGTLTLIQRIDRLPEALAALGGRMGAVQVLPVTGRAGRAAGLFVLHAVKGRRTPFCLLPPLVLHCGAAHPGDAEHYTHNVQAVLRNVAPLPGYPVS